jgi:hypothetical protein
MIHPTLDTPHCLGGIGAPLCYPQDVSDGMVSDWRRRSGQ